MLNVANIEILQIIDAVAKEKNISKDTLINAMEQAIAAAGRKKYGNEHNIQSEINKKTGEIILFRIINVTSNVENSFTEISLKDALLKDHTIKIGDEIRELLPSIELGRVAAQTTKQVITQKMLEIDREKQYNDYKSKKYDLVNGTVKRIELGDIFVDLGRTEAILKKNQIIKGEYFKINDRIKAFVQDVKLQSKGPQIFLSRTDDKMLTKLFELEVPEIYDNIIEIKAVARDPGSKAKIAVFAADISVDAVGSCVGIKASRVKAITDELCGEKIDIVLWSNNLAQFVVNALAPAEIIKIIIDENKRKVDAIVSPNFLSMAIGRKGQNVRLASKLTGWNIDVLTEDQESKRRTTEFKNSTSLFMKHLDVEEMIGQLLSSEGFTTIEQLTEASVETLSNIEGFDMEIAEELKDRAMEYVKSNDDLIISKLEGLGVEQELIDILNLPANSILKLAEYGIKTIEDLGEVKISEFKKLLPSSNLTDEEIELLINSAKS
jgi:N utilization substance protein A